MEALMAGHKATVNPVTRVPESVKGETELCPKDRDD